jgi:hypothetical protein
MTALTSIGGFLPAGIFWISIPGPPLRSSLILDLATADAAQLFALAAAILAFGGVYWPVREQDRRERI